MKEEGGVREKEGMGEEVERGRWGWGRRGGRRGEGGGGGGYGDGNGDICEGGACHLHCL